MFNFITKSIIQITHNAFQISSSHKLHFIELKRLYSSSSKKSKKELFMVYYLINSCGFTPEKAVSASKYVNFSKPEKPNAVISFFKNQGFSDSDVFTLIRKYPKVLDLLPERNLLPKIEFLRSFCPLEADLSSFLVLYPQVLGRSLENQIIPSFRYFKNLVGSNNELISIVKSFPALLMYRHVVAPNVDILVEAGVPMENIAAFLRHYSVKILHCADRYKELVDEVKEMGIHPQKFVFMLAVMVRSGLSKSTWEKKMELYEKWGCSEKVVMTAFKNYPYCMAASVGKIEAVFEYLVNEMGWEAPILMKTPLVLAFSLKRRIIPRCSVLRVLLSEGLIKNSNILLQVLKVPERKFLVDYVSCHENKDQELLKLYNEKLKQES
ncbi:hypothetical protein LIER_01114 [Lithospermum erythrorhizon]|uniref:Uncharacterized protein n=1 Tax=Lithospermum erythrorhizon TaxID=34254 RepID=A0AAV3NJS8_LITER